MSHNNGLTPAQAIFSEGFDAIIDVRSPAEFAHDHIPGAINCPVLSDAERVQVGTLYKQVSPFEARKLGAALVARNIAQHLEQHFAQQPKHWRPLIYCWRGGQRSGAMQIILRQIGWQAQRLDGGYKAFRQHVIHNTAELAPRLRWHVLCAATGSGKTRLLQALAAQGAQTFDLEVLAAHKGSVLGSLPSQDQPTQKAFETALWQQLIQLDPSQPVFVEAESRKIGQLHIPGPLIDAIRQGTRVDLQAPLAARVAFLLQDYAHLLHDPAAIQTRLLRLKARHGGLTIAHWQDLVAQQHWAQLVQELLQQHYDPLYHQSQNLSYQGQRAPAPWLIEDLSPSGIEASARRIMQRYVQAQID